MFLVSIFLAGAQTGVPLHLLVEHVGEIVDTLRVRDFAGLVVLIVGDDRRAVRRETLEPLRVLLIGVCAIVHFLLKKKPS